MRGLALAAIVFAAIEAALAVSLGFGLGTQVALPAGAADLTGPYAARYLRVCGEDANGANVCLVSVDSISYGGNSATGSGAAASYFTRPIGIYFSGDIGASQYLFYGAGATLFPAAANIALSVLALSATNVIAGVVDAPNVA